MSKLRICTHSFALSKFIINVLYFLNLSVHLKINKMRNYIRTQFSI